MGRFAMAAVDGEFYQRRRQAFVYQEFHFPRR